MSQLEPRPGEPCVQPRRSRRRSRRIRPLGESGENFPVASRVLPPSCARDLRAVYGVARAIDDLGDEAPGTGCALLDEFEADLRQVWARVAPRSAGAAAAGADGARHALSIEPFLALIAANRLDQTQPSYPTWADSAALLHAVRRPGRADRPGGPRRQSRPDRLALSDDVCTALQLLEHCQDVAEDRRRGRTYLPVEDLAGPRRHRGRARRRATSPSVRAAGGVRGGPGGRDCSRSGRPLVRSLRGAGRAGGRRLCRRRPGDRRRVAARRLRRAARARHRAAAARRRPPRGPRLLAVPGMTVTSSTQAYSICEAITGTQARNFHYGIRLLPGTKRLGVVRGLRAGPPGRRHRRRRPAAEDASARARPSSGGRSRRMADSADPVLVAVRRRRRAAADPARGVRRADRRRRDGRRRHSGTRRSTTWSCYCRCVAGSIGRLCLGVFGADRPATRAPEYADAARHRVAADQHPARHPRGPASRPGLPACRGPRPVRRRPASSTPTARSSTTAACPS